jgi:hypothetical protein
MPVGWVARPRSGSYVPSLPDRPGFGGWFPVAWMGRRGCLGRDLILTGRLNFDRED